MKNKGLMIAALGLFFFVQAAQADWTPAKRITWNPAVSLSPAVALDSSGNVHVVWIDRTPGNYEVFYRSSMDGGVTWGTSKRLTWTPLETYRPAIAIDSLDAIHVVWFDYAPDNWEIYYRRSSDGGTSWSPSLRLTSTPGSSENPAIAVDSNDILHVVWSDDTSGNDEIYYKRSSDGGTTWSGDKWLTSNTGASLCPAITERPGGTIHVVWQEETPGNKEIYYRGSSDAGLTWKAPRRITWTTTDSQLPAVGQDAGGRVHVVWYDGASGDWAVFYKRSPDGGATWDPAKRMTWTSAWDCSPVLAVDSADMLHVVWVSYISGGSYEIYCKTSGNQGTTWGAAQRLSWNSGESYNPDVAADFLGKVHVVWQDSTPGNLDIYYKNGN